MSELSESQLLLLDNLIYLQNVVNREDMTVGSIVKTMLYKDGLEQSRNLNDIGGEDEYPCKMSKKEWVTILKAIEKDPELKALKVKHGQTGVMYNKSGQVIKDSDGQVLEKGMRVATFVDPKGQATVVFRGTGGDYEWHDNGQGGYVSDTVQQKAALKYIESLEYDNITVTGHSKGGNKTQYVAILSDKVDRAVSFDGQGFSKEFLEKYKDEIAANKHKIVSISAEDDFVNCLLNPIAGVIKYIDTDKQEKFIFNHRPNIVLDEQGQLREKAPQGTIAQFINDYTVYINKTMEEPFRSYAIDGLLALMESGAEGFEKEGVLQTGTGIVMVLSHLDDYAFSSIAEKYGDEAELAVTFAAGALMPYLFSDDFIHSLGKNLSNLGQFVMEKLQQFGDWIVKKFEQAVDKMKEVAGNIGAAVAKFAQQVKDGWAQMRAGIQDTARAIKDGAEAAAAAVGQFMTRMAQAIKNLCNAIVEGAKKTIQALKDTWNSAVDAVKHTFHQVKEGAKAKVKDFKEGMQSMVKLTKSGIKSAGKHTAATVKNFAGKVARGLASASQGLMLVNVSRLGDLQAKLRSLDSRMEGKVTKILSEAQRITSGVGRAYSEGNVQSQLRQVQKACSDVRDRSRRLSAELQRKTRSLAKAQEQYIKIEMMLKSGIRSSVV
ncbi:hypothetical protein DCC85_16310 [Paenibacillus sp. CAA11]|uniref:Mbeg1-like protein n=1 Tax=Paenibacillus sp. CAA11 TaxID=1532905 RepID=UPI000D3C6F48|nr:Mbeg1-like protein [Paenibacillus sp. CAA11]AWB45602.1 hypothetical protein DCC85_16310 [Paenibacillus sp. CAA11]